MVDTPRIPPSPAQPGGPLSHDHLRELADARRAAAKVRRAGRIAAFSGWSMAIFGAITLVGGVLGDVVSLVLGIGLCAAAWNELRGGARIKRFEPNGARILGWNQIGVGALIVTYAAWSLRVNLGSSALASVGGTTGDAVMDAMVTDIAMMVTWGLYGGLIVVGIVVPGLTALYYFSRERIVCSFVERTPVWVVDTLRAAG